MKIAMPVKISVLLCAFTAIVLGQLDLLRGTPANYWYALGLGLLTHFVLTLPYLVYGSLVLADSNFPSIVRKYGLAWLSLFSFPLILTAMDLGQRAVGAPRIVFSQFSWLILIILLLLLFVIPFSMMALSHEVIEFRRSALVMAFVLIMSQIISFFVVGIFRVGFFTKFRLFELLAMVYLIPLAQVTAGIRHMDLSEQSPSENLYPTST